VARYLLKNGLKRFKNRKLGFFSALRPPYFADVGRGIEYQSCRDPGGWFVR